jgi:DNA mismatch repair ATPase MutS
MKASDLPQALLPPLPLEEEPTSSKPERKYPPLLQQHLNNMRAFSDCILLTRVGDFYEMYFDHVDQYAPLVNLKKARKPTALGDVAMAGFQHTQLERYLKLFVQDLGKPVAISEQIRIPDAERVARNGGPQFDRKVTRVITAGTLIDETFMDPFENNFVLAIHFAGTLPELPTDNASRELYERYRRSTKVGLSWADLSSGDFFTQYADLATLPSLVARVNPKEVVLEASLEKFGPQRLQKLIGDNLYSIYFHQSTDLSQSISDWTPMLERAVEEDDQSEFTPVEVTAGSLVLDYIRDKVRDAHIQLQPPVRKTIEEYMAIDKQSLRNLEIRSTLRDGLTQGSLLHAVRRTVTKSGARLLNQRLVAPSTSLSIINNRLDLVQELLDHEALREDIIALLKRTSDTYRLLQKFSIGRGDADDLLGLARTIELMQQVSEIVHDHIINRLSKPEIEGKRGSDEVVENEYTFLWDILTRLDLETPLKVARNIQAAIDEEGLNQKQLVEEASVAEAEQMTDEVISADAAGEKVPKLSRRKGVTQSLPTTTQPDEIWIMRRNASTTLDRAHKDLDELLSARDNLTTQLRETTNTEGLTLRWSAGLGHFCHIKHKSARAIVADLPGARAIGSTKGTVSFYLSDWTHLGSRLDDAKLRIRSEEDRFFRKLRSEVLENLMKLRRNASVLDELDVACSSAIIAHSRSWVRPLVHPGTAHHIIGGRHPTVDLGLSDSGRSFTANDCAVGSPSPGPSSTTPAVPEPIYLITGPNMGGKSTYLRQNALITILAQTGLFVPATYASIGLVDQLFSRVGSADNLFADQSTFMVEMLETAEILKSATPKSFVIMDEVGRGTTPEDGLAVGYACLWHLAHVNRSRVLFATHFHGLTDLTRGWEGVGCFCTDVEEQELEARDDGHEETNGNLGDGMSVGIEERGSDGDSDGGGAWTYLHKLQRGVNRSSHALKVARLAGLPESAIGVAEKMLREVKGGQQSEKKQKKNGKGVMAK